MTIDTNTANNDAFAIGSLDKLLDKQVTLIRVYAQSDKNGFFFLADFFLADLCPEFSFFTVLSNFKPAKL